MTLGNTTTTNTITIICIIIIITTTTTIASWCVEFLEHVSRHYIKNYMPSFHKCAVIFTTRSEWGGYHHVEVHPEWWWIARFHSQGFIYDASLTAATKLQAW